VLQTEWANIGTLHLQRSGSFETLLSLPYAFNKNVTFGWMGRRDQHPDVFPKRSNPKFALFEAHELDQAIEAIIEYACSQMKVTVDA